MQPNDYMLLVVMNFIPEGINIFLWLQCYELDLQTKDNLMSLCSFLNATTFVKKIFSDAFDI